MAETATTSTGIVLARAFWMLLGPLALFLIGYHIVASGTGWLTGTDLAFFVVLGGMLLARWVEFRTGAAQTAAGAPATGADLRRYVLSATLGGLAVWIVANAVGNHVFH